ncbi:phytanoyl-CoA dioxygenase family protein [Burkholderia gladioli]|uniref:phytanoyl-CoA dioxygenase family protein n=1 Tax=Burkholderia gladioli TaxID=28095 RepID=UPI0016406199|nr:phytanoyl-CoA dioxygenase family protein [Burkholderia gladioli]
MKPRNAPTVWNGTGPLDREQMERYARDGFVLLKDVLDRSLVDELRREVDRLRLGEHPSTIYERDTRTVRSVFDAHQLSETVLTRVVNRPFLLDVSEQILGKGLYVHQCHVNFKSPGGGGFGWHSDFTFWFWEDGMPEPRAISLFIFLDAARAETGPLCVIPGSHDHLLHTEWYRCVEDHKQAVRHDDPAHARQNGLIEFDQLREITGGTGIETIWGEPGDVLVMDGNLAHASGPNFGVHERRVLLLILNHIDNRIGKPYSGAQERPGFISSRNFTVIR